MSDPLSEVVMAAAELKMIAPGEFERLVVAMKALEKACDNELRAAGPNVIFTAQGKSQLVTQLCQKLENCLALKRTYEQRK